MSTGYTFYVPAEPSLAPVIKGIAPPVSDLLLFHTADGGEIELINGQPTMSDGLATAAYLSLFGGNELDSGLQGDDRKQWWANLSETDPARMYRSRTQCLLRAIPAIPANLRRVEDAASSDLAWFLDEVASAVDVAASMPALNRVVIAIKITVASAVYELSFASKWSAA
jgi:phage gp46-like protein